MGDRCNPQEKLVEAIEIDESSVASFAGSVTFADVTPGSAAPSPGANTLSACFAGSLKGYGCEANVVPGVLRRANLTPSA